MFNVLGCYDQFAVGINLYRHPYFACLVPAPNLSSCAHYVLLLWLVLRDDYIVSIKRSYIVTGSNYDYVHYYTRVSKRKT